MRRRSWGIAAGLLGLAAGLIYGATGLAVVEPGRVVVVRRFGRALPEPWGPGPHLGLPWGFERRDTVRIGEVRRVEVGVVERPGIAGGLGAGEFLTGDLNLVRLRAQIRYRVADPVAFVVATDDPSGLLARLAESAIARTVAARGIDGLLGPDRAILAASTRDRLARDTDRAGIGVAILAVGFSEVRPPAEVRAAFDDAQAARGELVRRRIEAQSYADASKSDADAEVAARLDAAATEATRTVAMAEARAGRFLGLLEAARTDRDLTARRLYHDTLRDLLPKLARAVVLAPGEPIDLSLFADPDPPLPDPNPTEARPDDRR